VQNAIAEISKRVENGESFEKVLQNVIAEMSKNNDESVEANPIATKKSLDTFKANESNLNTNKEELRVKEKNLEKDYVKQEINKQTIVEMYKNENIKNEDSKVKVKEPVKETYQNIENLEQQTKDEIDEQTDKKLLKDQLSGVTKELSNNEKRDKELTKKNEVANLPNLSELSSHEVTEDIPERSEEKMEESNDIREEFLKKFEPKLLSDQSDQKDGVLYANAQKRILSDSKTTDETKEDGIKLIKPEEKKTVNINTLDGRYKSESSKEIKTNINTSEKTRSNDDPVNNQLKSVPIQDYRTTKATNQNGKSVVKQEILKEYEDVEGGTKNTSGNIQTKVVISPDYRSVNQNVKSVLGQEISREYKNISSGKNEYQNTQTKLTTLPDYKANQNGKSIVNQEASKELSGANNNEINQKTITNQNNKSTIQQTRNTANLKNIDDYYAGSQKINEIERGNKTKSLKVEETVANKLYQLVDRTNQFQLKISDASANAFENRSEQINKTRSTSKKDIIDNSENAFVYLRISENMPTELKTQRYADEKANNRNLNIDYSSKGKNDSEGHDSAINNLAAFVQKVNAFVSPNLIIPNVFKDSQQIVSSINRSINKEFTLPGERESDSVKMLLTSIKDIAAEQSNLPIRNQQNKKLSADEMLNTAEKEHNTTNHSVNHQVTYGIVNQEIAEINNGNISAHQLLSEKQISDQPKSNVGNNVIDSSRANSDGTQSYNPNEELRNTVQQSSKNKLEIKAFEVEYKRKEEVKVEQPERPVVSNKFIERLAEMTYKGIETKVEQTYQTNNRFELAERLQHAQNLEEIYQKIREFGFSNRLEENVRMKLYPENLGNLDVELKKEGRFISIVFVAENEKGKELLEKNAGYLRDRLTNLDFEVRTVEVKMKEENNNYEDGRQQKNGQEQSGQNNQEHRRKTFKEEVIKDDDERGSNI
jgi:flagellar hook-length control protein FliK